MKNPLAYIVLSCLLPGTILAAAPTPMIGLRGDTSGVFSGDCNPLTTGHEYTTPAPTNTANPATTNPVVWKTALPDGSLSSPIVVRGRVFIACGPGQQSDSPSLVCCNASDGKILWTREIDHFLLLPDDERTRYQNERKKRLENSRTQLTPAHKATSISPPGNEPCCPFSAPTNHSETSTPFPTPVSDGERIYVWTPCKVMACFELDGTCRWMRWHREDPYPLTRLPGHFAASPLIHANTLVAHAGNFTWAYDLASGRTLWKLRTDTALPLSGTPVPLMLPRTNGTPVAALFLPSGELVRMTDGWILCKDVATFSNGNTVFGNNLNTIYGQNAPRPNSAEPPATRLCTDPGFVAIRFTLSLHNTSAKPELLWSSDSPLQLGSQPGVCYNDQIVTPAGAIIDATTGKLIRPAIPGLNPDQSIVVAAGHAFGVNDSGLCTVFELTGSVSTVRNQLPVSATNRPTSLDQGTQLTNLADQTSQITKPFGLTTTPFPSGNRLFTRSSDQLCCLGNPAEPTKLSVAHGAPIPLTITPDLSTTPAVRLAEMLESRSPDEQLAAIHALLRTGAKPDTRTLTAVAKAYKAASLDFQIAACQWFKANNDVASPAVDLLAPLLDDPHPDTRQAALLAVRAIGPAAATCIPNVQAIALNSTSPDLASLAVLTLSAIDASHTNLWPIILARLEKETPEQAFAPAGASAEYHARLARALSGMGTTLLPTFIEKLNDRSTPAPVNHAILLAIPDIKPVDINVIRAALPYAIGQPLQLNEPAARALAALGGEQVKFLLQCRTNHDLADPATEVLINRLGAQAIPRLQALIHDPILDKQAVAVISLIRKKLESAQQTKPR